jgi:TrmH family RNA methyltransferase
MKEIFSKQNSFIKDLKKQKLKNSSLLFLDNPKSINDVISYGLSPRFVLVDKEKQAKLELPEGAEVVLTNDEIIKMFASTITPQGIVAVFEFLPKKPKVPQGNYLVLDGLQDAGNIGTLLRSALGANFQDVFLIDSVHITNTKIVRSSMSAVLRLGIYEMSREDFCSFAKQNGLSLAKCDMDGINIFETIPNTPVGIVVGSEGSGVSKEVASLCKTNISIPMANGLESLNAGVAGSIIMFEITNKKGK